MRRLSFPALIVFVISLSLAAGRIAAQSTDDEQPSEGISIETTDSPETTDSDSAKPDESDESDEAAKKIEAAKEAEKAEAEKKEKEKAEAEAKEKEKEKEKKKDEATAKDKEKAAKPEGKAAAKDEKKKPEAKPEPKKRKTQKVDTKRMKVDVPLDGVFVARKTEEIPLKPKAWSEFEIEDVIEHGTKVHKGERLIKFDDDKINEALADMELDQRISELTILRSEEEMPRMEKTLKMDFQDAHRSNNNAKEDFKRYNDVDRPMAIKSAEFMLKFYNFMLDYEKDELNELEKMYKADDLTEETEEIVLKRQRNQVEFAEFSLENAKIETEEMVKIRIPRADIRIRELLDRTALAKARAQMALNIDLNRARYELEQRKKARTKSLERHTKLLGDKELMEIKSPADGIVFFGQCVNGRWSDMQSLINRYKPKNNLSAGSVIMTIVQPRPLYITSTVDESKRPGMSDGQKAKIALPVEGSDRLNGEVKSISPIPISSGKFEINFDLPQDQIPDWVVPGMSCKVQVNVYDKKDALVVPKKAVHDDKDDPDQHYVWLVKADDEEAKPERRIVKLGKRKDDDIEILKGLKKGDVISLDDEDAKEKAEKEKEKTE